MIKNNPDQLQMETHPNLPSDVRTGTLETFSPERSVVDQMVIDGIAQAISELRIEQAFGEGLIKSYLANRKTLQT